MRTIRITGTGSALPGRIVTNKELEQLVETSDEWIRERTGIAERHVSVGETVVTLASEAARKALEQAGKRAEEIDLILVATCSPEQYLPCCACQVQADIGAVNALAAADMALAGITSKIPVDQVIDAMKEVGDKMDVSLRETGVGGVAGTPAAQEVVEKLGM